MIVLIFCFFIAASVAEIVYFIKSFFFLLLSAAGWLIFSKRISNLKVTNTLLLW